MTRSRLSLALCMTVLLIGVAIWKRAERSTITVSNLAAVQQDNDILISNQDAENAALAEAAPADGADPSSASTTDLTETDMVGRQLISNYLNLASNGEATDENITSLADAYADGISSLTSYKPLTEDDLKVVADSQDNFQAYSDALASIYTKYQGLTASALKQAGDISDITSKNFASAMGNLSQIYGKAAIDLAAVPVPASLSDDHLKLTNNYLSSATNLYSMAKISTDSVGAIGGLSAQASNNSDEQSILGDIATVLAVKGIGLAIGS